VKIVGQQKVSATMADDLKFPSLSDFESVFRDPLGNTLVMISINGNRKRKRKF
jgi:hypothetical protein